MGVDDSEQRLRKKTALDTARFLIEVTKLSREDAISNPAIPPELRDYVRQKLKEEENITLEPAHYIVDDGDEDWFQHVDRSAWYYWPELRNYLLANGWTSKSIQSLDSTTDRILMRLKSPYSNGFDVRGLVLGYVQSGKTSNFTAVMAKAADCKYRLFIVLSGIDKGLRRQTQIRLDRELMGKSVNPNDNRHVRLPPQGLQWHSFTTNDIDGDFDPGNSNPASLQGPEPVIMVVKKNGTVLRRLLQWLNDSPSATLREIPTMIIDDEADLASIDTRGTYQTEDETPSEDYEHPSVINGLIRELLTKFQKRAYIAYTATPFANILIPDSTYDPAVQRDLYPKNFIVDLPKPTGYFGAEELFGLTESSEAEEANGLGVMRSLSDRDLLQLEIGEIPPGMENAILGFVLSCAARAQRGEATSPSTMLVHTSHRIESHMDLASAIQGKFSEFKDAWRYDNKTIIPALRELWDSDFRVTTQRISPEIDVDFERIRPYIGDVFEAIQVRTINSFTGAVLDYEREPSLKSIGIGGNKLSRGLTLEGLTTSFFVRNSPAYDTLMQMGRWFGFRTGYEDLTRIWTTRNLADRFVLLAQVEMRLRDDIRVYEDMQVTPSQLGMRIYQHSTMQVTSYLKRRFARKVEISQSYSGQLEQTFKFPFDSPQELALHQDRNASLVEKFVDKMGKASWEDGRPTWMNVPGERILEFLNEFEQDEAPDRNGCSLQLISAYIDHQLKVGELTNWTVSIRGRETENNDLGATKWKVEGKSIWQVSRTRIKNTYSLGVITSPGDEKIGLSEDVIERAEEIRKRYPDIGGNRALRMARPPTHGMLLIYPISKKSAPEERFKGSRENLFEHFSDSYARDLVAIAISFPESQQPQPVQAYLEGTVRWRAYDEQS
ncbi:MAG: Z1 domain-containing protein [Thermoplasmataceae archaeon]